MVEALLLQLQSEGLQLLAVLLLLQVALPQASLQELVLEQSHSLHSAPQTQLVARLPSLPPQLQLLLELLELLELLAPLVLLGLLQRLGPLELLAQGQLPQASLAQQGQLAAEQQRRPLLQEEPRSALATQGWRTTRQVAPQLQRTALGPLLTLSR